MQRTVGAGEFSRAGLGVPAQQFGQSEVFESFLRAQKVFLEPFTRIQSEASGNVYRDQLVTSALQLFSIIVVGARSLFDLTLFLVRRFAKPVAVEEISDIGKYHSLFPPVETSRFWGRPIPKSS